MDLADKIFVTGYAEPTDDQKNNFNEVAGLSLIILRKDESIIDADVSTNSTLLKQFFKEIILGKNINNIKEVIRQFDNYNLGHDKEIIISALKNAYDRYINYRRIA